MINVEKGKVKEILKDFHKVVGNRWTAEDAENLLMSRILDELFNNPKLEPVVCAKILNEKYEYHLTGNDVINYYRIRCMANPIDREAVIKWAKEISEDFAAAMYGNKSAYEKLNAARKVNVTTITNSAKNPQNYVLVNYLYKNFPEIDIFGDGDRIRNLPVVPCKFLIFDLMDIIAKKYGFETFKDKKTVPEDATTQEITQFFSSLNSEKYGYILDELLKLRKGVDELRKKNYQVPLELNGVYIMIMKLIQFVRDSHINPIMKVDSILTVKASDIEFCSYEGSPFLSKEETKKVRVVSPGWILSDKEIQISSPYLKEIKDE